MTALLDPSPDDSGCFSGSRQVAPLIWRGLRPKRPGGDEKAVLRRQRGANLPWFSGTHESQGAHVTVASGGARKAAMFCMISANNLRGIATSAI